MSLSPGAGANEELSGTPIGPSRNLLEFLVKLITLFDGCEVLVQPMAFAGAGSSSETRQCARLHGAKVISLADFRRPTQRA